MEHIGNLLATITSVRAEERLRAIAQLDLAIAIFLSDIESAAEVAVLIAMIEQVITSIAATGQGLALNNVRDIATALENFHCRACRLYCIYDQTLWSSTLPSTLAPTTIFAPPIGRTLKCRLGRRPTL